MRALRQYVKPTCQNGVDRIVGGAAPGLFSGECRTREADDKLGPGRPFAPTSISPPWASMIRFTIAKPNPLPFGLVVIERVEYLALD